MTITRVGSNKQFATGWDAIFGGSTKKSTSAKKPATAKKKAAPKKKGAKNKK